MSGSEIVGLATIRGGGGAWIPQVGIRLPRSDRAIGHVYEYLACALIPKASSYPRDASPILAGIA